MPHPSTHPSPSFIPLNNKTLAEYTFLYHIRDEFAFTELEQVANKWQLSFLKLNNKQQQFNLLLVDSMFINIFSDLALDVFLHQVKSFEQFIDSPSRLLIFDVDDQKYFLRHKFLQFLNLFLFSDVASYSPCHGTIFSERVYCLKNKSAELEYYSILEQSQLQLKLIKDLKLSIDFSKSQIINQSLNLVLKIQV